MITKLTILPKTKNARGVKTQKAPVKPQVARLVQGAFDHVDTTFGRLILCACLLDRETEIYVCPLVSVAYGYEPVDQALRDMHQCVLKNWLDMSAAQRKSDVQQYLEHAFHGDPERGLNLIQDRSYDDLLPLESAEGDRKRFLTGIERTLVNL